MKLALFILSDPKAGDDALGRLFNGLALAAEAQAAGDEVALHFIAAGTRWPEELQKLDHPARALYQSVQETVRGASCACSEVFGAKEGVEASGVPLLTDHPLAGTTGMASLRRYLAEDWKTLTF